MVALEEQSSRWRAAASPGGLIGLFLVILCVVAGVTAYLAITERFSLPFPDMALWAGIALAAIATVLFAFLLWVYLSIGYRLESDSLLISWGPWSERIPLLEIESIAPAEEILGPGRTGWKPLWPGFYLGLGRTEVGEVRVVATMPRRRQVLIRLFDGRIYAISPERPLLFMEEIVRWHEGQRPPEPAPAGSPVEEAGQPTQRFVDAGWTTEYSTHDVAQQTAQPAPESSGSEVADPARSARAQAGTRVYRAPPSSTSPLLRPILLRDPVALSLIVLGVLATGAMVTYILIQYDDIPQSLTLHWNAEGLPGRVGEPREIWILPTIAGLVLLANVGLAWSIALFDRFAARLMLGATVIAHIVTWVALLMLIG